MKSHSAEPNSETLSQATALAAVNDSDILFVNSPIARSAGVTVIDLCSSRKRRPNLILVLVTEGGDPDAAYRIGRGLQSNYQNVSCLVSGYCKSAGTLIALGARELVFGPHGELGPVDVQMSKRDELYEMQSGQTVMSALDTLQEKAFMAFERYFLDIQQRSVGRVSLKAATEIASRLAIGLFQPVYQQIDPMHIGEAGRASAIARQYGERLSERFRNLKPNAIDYLMTGYASHGFVIDELEARRLFHNVRRAGPKELALLTAMGDESRHPQLSHRLEFLTEELKESNRDADHDNDGRANGSAKPDRRSRKAPAVAEQSVAGGDSDSGRLPKVPSRAGNGNA